MNFRVGQKVVCVDARDTAEFSPFPTINCGMDGLAEGTVYTIRRLGDFRGVFCLWLEEIKRPLRTRGEIERFGESGYCAARFRHLVEKKTDAGMAILKTILDEVNAEKHREIVDA